MKPFVLSISLLLPLWVMMLSVATAQHIELQPATGGVTALLSPTANDTALSINAGKTIRIRPGAGGFAVGTPGSEVLLVKGSTITVNSGINSYVFPATRPGAGQVLTAADGIGTLTWSTPAAADNLGNHTATQALNLGTFKLVGNGGTTGISISAAGAVTADNALTVTGATTLGGGTTFNTSTNTFTMPTTRGTNGQVLTSNGAGAASWSTSAAADNLGNHTATQALNLASFKLVGSGGTLGISIGGSGNITADANLSVAGASTLTGLVTYNSGVNSYTMPTTRGTNGQYLSISGSTVVWSTPLNGFTNSSNAAIGTGAGTAISTGTGNTLVGPTAGSALTAGGTNTFIGNAAGGNVTTSSGNIAIGDASLLSLSFNNGGTNWNGSNIAIGKSALLSLNSTATSNGTYNIAIGESALMNNITGNRNIAIGGGSGIAATGSDNIFIGYQSGWGTSTSNKLYIENSSNVTSPLIGGDFSANTVSIGGTLSVNASPNTYSLPTTLGTNGQVLTTNGSGTTSWTTVGGADNLGNHTATQALSLSTFKLVGNGGTTGISVSAAGAVTLDNNLAVTGSATITGSTTHTGTTTLAGTTTFNTATNTFTMPTTRGTNGQVLTSNGSGATSWSTPAAADNLGNHTATQALNLSTFKLVGNGGTAGLSISNTGAATFDNTLNAGTITVGGAINANAGNFNAGVSSSDYLYMSSAMPRVKTVSHLQFFGLASGTRGTVGSSSVAEYAYFSASPAVANLELPDGATVTSIDVYMSQTAGTSTVKLIKMTSTGTTVMGTASITGTVTAGTPTNATFTSFTVNNTTDTYALQYDGAGNGINYKLYRVVVNYTVAKPD